MNLPLMVGIAVVAVGVIVGLVMVRRRKATATDDSELISFVLLRRRGRPISDDELRAAIVAAYPAADSGTEDAGPVVALQGPIGLVFVQGDMLTFHNHDERYLDAESVRTVDSTLQDALREHQAWTSIDWTAATPEDVDGVYRTLGRIISAFADDDVLAIAAPGRQLIISVRAGLWDDLKNGEGLAALSGGEIPITTVDSDDPEMIRAVEEARSKFGEFESAFLNRHKTPSQSFFAKAPFGDPDEVEFMWFRVEWIENGKLGGVLDNSPAKVKGLKSGDRVSIPVDQLNDWMIAGGKDLVGGFTVKVVAARGAAQRDGKE